MVESMLEKFIEKELKSGKRRDSHDVYAISLEEPFHSFFFMHELERLAYTFVCVIALGKLSQDFQSFERGSGCSADCARNSLKMKRKKVLRCRSEED